MSGEWFHASKTIIKRSQGRSVVAAAAYRTASSLTCDRERMTHDYTRKRGVAEVFTTVPESKPGLEWAQDIPRLVNAMEASEKRKDAQLGHEWTIALPSELNDAQRLALSHEMAQTLSELYGVAVIGAIHRPGHEGDERNHHVHLLFTTREIEADGKLGAKVTVLTGLKTGPQEVKRFRQIAADLINDALADAGSSERVSPLSFEARGIDRLPSEHLGPSASEMERRAPGSSDRGDMNREIAAHNRAMDELVVELAALDAEIAEHEEQQLDNRYGSLEPGTRIIQPSEPAPLLSQATPREALAASFDAAIGLNRNALNVPLNAERWMAPPGFDAAIRPALIAFEQTGETWLGARRWQKAAEIYQRGKEMIADLGQEVSGYWQRTSGRNPDTGRQNEPRGYWRHVVTRNREPGRDIDGPER